ncbi:MAG: pilus assembly PilX N-terminal domain-containing protein [Chloroflexi bacterium]|nr:pilus assembly PilX N-terminal domain-containing protein [Chloroflexota bacterium]
MNIKNKRGIALITVMLISVIMLIMILSVFGITSNNALFMSNFRDRTSALYAAEAGIHKAMYQLSTDPYFAGNISETMSQGLGSFSADVTNGGLTATIISTGTIGAFSRTVRAVVETDANAYSALVCDGKITLSGDSVYINGIKSVKYPKIELGNIHTNSSALDAIAGDPSVTKVTITGKATAVGGVQNVIPDGHRQSNASKIAMKDLDKSALLNVTFTQSSIPADGQITQNTRIEGNLQINGNLRLNNNTVLYVVGDLNVKGALTGQGAVVVEGTTKLEGITELDLDNKTGVVIYGEGDVSVAHPLYTEEGKGYTRVEDVDVAKFFADMPANAPQSINSNLPPDAPRDSSFFQWYYEQSAASNPSSSFIIWRDGNPLLGQEGLSPDVKAWLDSGSPMSTKVQTWDARNRVKNSVEYYKSE